MSRPRLVQHRVQRDTPNREIAELKRENEQLRRQVARLRKQLNHEEDPDEESDPVPEDPKPTCPMCSSTNLSNITTPTGKSIYACKGCRKWRGPVPASL